MSEKKKETKYLYENLSNLQFSFVRFQALKDTFTITVEHLSFSAFHTNQSIILLYNIKNTQ